MGKTETKTCTKCKIEKNLTEFYKGAKGTFGTKSVCIDCCRKYKKDYRSDQKNVDKLQNQRLIYSYGLTLEQHKSLYLEQNGCCAICNGPVAYNDLLTDHNHKTGKARGLLCRKCNLFLAGVEDECFAIAAEKYLERHKSNGKMGTSTCS